MKWTGKDYRPKRQTALEVNFRSLKMKNELARFFITQNKIFTVRFPNLPNYLKGISRGKFDADGSICKAIRMRKGKSGQIYISYGGEFDIQGNKDFILALQSRFMKLGLPQNSINYSGKSINRVRYGGINQLRIIYKYLYEGANIFLERKKKLFEDILKNYRCEIIWQQKDSFKLSKITTLR